MADNNNGPYFCNDILNFKFYSEDTDYKNGYSAFSISPSFRIECRDDFAPERNKNHNATLYIYEEAPPCKEPLYNINVCNNRFFYFNKRNWYNN